MALPARLIVFAPERWRTTTTDGKREAYATLHRWIDGDRASVSYGGDVYASLQDAAIAAAGGECDWRTAFRARGEYVDDADPTRRMTRLVSLGSFTGFVNAAMDDDTVRPSAFCYRPARQSMSSSPCEKRVRFAEATPVEADDVRRQCADGNCTNWASRRCSECRA